MTRLKALKALHEKVEAGGRIANEADAAFPGGAEGTKCMSRCIEAYNGSLDAAKALHEALLPGWVVRLTATIGKDRSYPYVHIYKMRDFESDAPLGANSSDYKGYSPARAWLLAILNAIIAQEADQ